MHASRMAPSLALRSMKSIRACTRHGVEHRVSEMFFPNKNMFASNEPKHGLRSTAHPGNAVAHRI